MKRSFGDVHYFYGPPTDHPPHHRFDKGSYIYLFENATSRQARVEIANQPGTDNQDAFDGCKSDLSCPVVAVADKVASQSWIGRTSGIRISRPAS